MARFIGLLVVVFSALPPAIVFALDYTPGNAALVGASNSKPAITSNSTALRRKELAAFNVINQLTVRLDKRAVKTTTQARDAILFCGHGGVPGHAFIIWANANALGQLQAVHVAGAYPNEVLRLGSLAPVPGRMVDERYVVDSLGESTYLQSTCYLAITVDQEVFNATLDKSRSWPTYQLGKTDCVTYVYQVAESIGLKVPARFGATGPTPIPSLERLQRANLPMSTNRGSRAGTGESYLHSCWHGQATTSTTPPVTVGGQQRPASQPPAMSQAATTRPVMPSIQGSLQDVQPSRPTGPTPRLEMNLYLKDAPPDRNSQK